MQTQELEVLQKALSDHGIALKTFVERQEAREADAKKAYGELMARVLEAEQKMTRKAAELNLEPSGKPGELTELITKSEQLAAFMKGTSRSVEITVPTKLMKNLIVNASGTAQPLVAPSRLPGIVNAPQRRFTIRDLLPSVPTSSNLVEFASELVANLNAGPQGGTSSPTSANGEGELKNESSLTFQLGSAPVVTIAHWIAASRQILSDAAALQTHLENRLMYGLGLEIETEILSGDGTNGKLNGLLANAAAFTGGSTNLSALDVVAGGIAQLIANEYSPSGIVLSPTDWWSSKFMLAKSTQGEYLLGDPGSMVEPRLWGLPVVVTNSMTKGNFMVMDGARVGYVADREDAIVRVAEQHSDFFLRNAIVLLCESRLAVVIQLGQAMVYGTLSYAG